MGWVRCPRCYKIRGFTQDVVDSELCRCEKPDDEKAMSEPNEAIGLIEGLVRLNCYAGNGVYDSSGISDWADAMRLLAKEGRFVVEREITERRVIGRFAEKPNE